jgi:pimeloyl-ACP methyl ester carboxylesterase
MKLTAFARSLLLAVWATSSGCVSTLSCVIATAPNIRKPDALLEVERAPLSESLLGIDDHFRVDVGPPAAKLSVSIIEPAERDAPPRGTILVLHGMGARSAWMHGTASDLADAGYRAVLVDLRGHGASTGDRLTYGLREALDLTMVIDQLEARRMLAGELGVYGISYGATTAIHLAGLDERVRAVVAVAPFSDMRSEVSHYVRTIGLPGVGPFLSEKYIQAAVDDAGRINGFSPDRADAAIAIQYTDAPVLLIHGKADVIIPCAHSERLHAAAPDHSELLLMPGLGHVTVWVDPLGQVGRASEQWFERYLAAPYNPRR